MTTGPIRYSEEAIHEASHFIIYMAFCKLNIQYPDVRELSLIPLHKKHIAYMNYREYDSPELIKAIQESTDIDARAKEHNRKATDWRIKVLLAGLAGEVINMGFDTKEGVASRVLKRWYDKGKNTDLCRAIEYNRAIGSNEEGPLQLLTIFEETIQDVKSYWEEVTTVAGILEEERIIKADRLEELTEQMINRINIDTIIPKIWQQNVK